MSASDFAAKVLSGEATSPEEWQEHLREVHARIPGCTSAAMARPETVDGETSYGALTTAAASAAEALNRRVDLLDLACGDGYLIELCLQRLGGSIETIAGVDMSEGELELARRRLAGRAVQMHVGMAQALPIAAESVDVVLCHMAFMLMAPLEPVVSEIARVLRPGGSFSAVVNSSSSTESGAGEREPEPEWLLPRRLTAELRQFWDEAYPGLLAATRVGDDRASTPDGWRELFRPEMGFTGAVETRDIAIVIRESKDGLWRFFSETYLIDLLDAESREELRRRLVSIMDEHQQRYGNIHMVSGLRMLSVCR